jgi:hypothetical protein
MPLMGFEPKIALFELEKTFRAGDRSATVMCRFETEHIETIDRFERLLGISIRTSEGQFQSQSHFTADSQSWCRDQFVDV